MEPYNPAKYALRAPPPIPPRPGVAPISSPRNDGPGPPIPPRPTSVAQTFPLPPRRHVQEGTQPPTYPQAYDPVQYGPPPAQMTSHYTPSPAPPQHSFLLSQQSIPPASSAYQSPPYYAPAPPTAQVPSGPEVPHYGAPADSPQYINHQNPEIPPLPSYQPPVTPTYPPPPTKPLVQTYGAPAGQESSAQQSTLHAQVRASRPLSYHAPPPVSAPLPAVATYPPPVASPHSINYVAPAMRESSTHQAAAKTEDLHAQPPSYLPSPRVSAPRVPTYPPPPHQDTDYGPPLMTANSRGDEGNQVKPALAQLSAHYFLPVASPTSSPSYTSSPQASNEAPTTAKRYGAGAAVVSAPPPRPQDTNYGPPVSSGGSEGNQTKPSLAQLSAHSFPPVTEPTYHEPYTISSQAPDEPHVTAERYAIGTPMKSNPLQSSSPYQSEPGAFLNYPPPSYEQPQAPPSPAGPPPLSASVSGIEILTESMSHTHIGPGGKPPKDQRSQPRSKTPPRPPIQYDAPANFTLRQCSSTEYTFSGKSQWYIHPQVPDFRICVYCYEKHVHSSQFEGEFHSWTSPAGLSPQCLFSCPRIEEDIWPRAVRSGDLRELFGFFTRRLSIPNCPRQRGVPATENVKWYQPRDKRKFPDFLACQACYEDVLLSGALRDGFMLFTGTQAKETLFICDAANLYVRKLATKTNNMHTFIPETIRHLRLPQCEKNGALTDGPSRKWYQLRSPSSSLITICERCFGEYAAHTEFNTHFQPIARPNKQHRCMLGQWQPRSVLDEALATLANHDFALFERTMLDINNTPLCTLEIQRGVPVYQIPGVENFDVCHACYVGLLKPFGMDKFFQRVRDPIYGQCACDLNAGTPRIAPFAKKLDEAMITATFETFATFAARFSTTDMCPKLNLTSGRTWYGNESCRICPACYEQVVRDSYLAKQGYFPPTPMTLTEETVCDLYSPRMRSKFNTACSTQDANSFLDFTTHRKNIYTQTVPEMRALVARSKHNLSMQKMYNTTSSAYNNMDGMGMYDTGVRYTGSGVSGVFRTHWGVEGAAMGQTALGYMQQIQVDAARVRYLQGVWNGVE